MDEENRDYDLEDMIPVGDEQLAGTDEQPEPGPAEPVVEPDAPQREHKEASCIAFTRVYDGNGNEWSLTLREGVTGAQVEHLFKAMKGSRKYAKEFGFTFDRTPAPTPPAASSKAQEYERGDDGKPTPAPVTRKPPIGGPSPVPGAKPQSSKAKTSGDREAIGRIKITPGSDPNNPRVEMFSANPRLQYSVLSAPVNIIADKLCAKYDIEPDELTWLYEVGKEWTVNWAVQIVLSEKLNRAGNPYKNVGELIDNDREEA